MIVKENNFIHAFHSSEIPKQELINVHNAVEYIKLLSSVIKRIPYQLTIKNWDVIRIGLGHWILSVTKSLDYALQKTDQKVNKELKNTENNN